MLRIAYFVLISLLYSKGENILEKNANDLLVNTTVGPIRGLRASNGNYTMFLGIPYAQVNQNNQFGVSVPYPTFDNVFEADNDSVVCPQLEGSTISGAPDCLRLNIYVPDSASPLNPLPVLFNIPGGGFATGSGNRVRHGPSFLVRHDVVIVSINYRLGPYGFMCLHTPEVPGNQGLKDQLLALRWVKNNIVFFGGDPNQVTVFGQSAGSMSIHMHLLSPHEDFFERVIMHSGSAFTITSIRESDKMAPLRIAALLGFVTDDINEALSFLSTIDSHSVIRASSQTNIGFFPCVEKDLDGVEQFLTDRTINLDVPKIAGKKVLLGYTNDEAIMVYANRPAESFPLITVFQDFLRTDFNFNRDHLLWLGNITTKFYVGSQTLSQDALHGIANFHSDHVFIYPTIRCIPSFLDNGAEEVYLFRFSYVGGRNIIRIQSNVPAGIGGAVHTDDLGYLFDIESLPAVPTPDDQLIIDRMTLMWTNFVKYGVPVPESGTLLPVDWEPITPDDLDHHFLEIDVELSTGTNPFHERTAFWNFFYETQKIYQLGYPQMSSAESSNVSRMLLSLALVLSVGTF